MTFNKLRVFVLCVLNYRERDCNWIGSEYVFGISSVGWENSTHTKLAWKRQTVCKEDLKDIQHFSSTDSLLYFLSKLSVLLLLLLFSLLLLLLLLCVCPRLSILLLYISLLTYLKKVLTHIIAHSSCYGFIRPEIPLCIFSPKCFQCIKHQENIKTFILLHL